MPGVVLYNNLLQLFPIRLCFPEAGITGRFIKQVHLHHKTTKKKPNKPGLTLKLDKAMRPRQIIGEKWGTQWQPVPLGGRKAHLGDWESLGEELSVPVRKDTDPNISSEQEEDEEKGAGAAPRGTAQT